MPDTPYIPSPFWLIFQYDLKKSGQVRPQPHRALDRGPEGAFIQTAFWSTGPDVHKIIPLIY